MSVGTFTETDLERASGGRFTSVVMLGQGITGTVFRAHDRQHPHVPWVAIKVSNGAGVPNTALMNEKTVLLNPDLQTFKSDWPSQAEPVLCQCYGELYFAPRVALVMEYLDPQVYIPLDTLLDQEHERWTDYQIVSILGPFVALLAQAHAAGYVYADISHDKAGHVLWNPTTRQTRSYDWGNVVDRRSSAAPSAITDVADIVGCGEVLYAMREGPFARLPQNPASYRRSESPELSDIIRRCLNRKTDDRFASAADLERAMRKYVTAQEQEVDRLEVEFNTLSANFRSLTDKNEQGQRAAELESVRAAVASINPWSKALKDINDKFGRDLDAVKLQNAASEAAEELKAAVHGPNLSLTALEDVRAYLKSYDELARDNTLPRPPADRALLGLVAEALLREKPRPDRILQAFVADCVEPAPNYGGLLNKLLHGRPPLDRQWPHPLLNLLGKRAGVTLLRLQTQYCLAVVQSKDIAELTAYLGRKDGSPAQVRRHTEKQLADLQTAVQDVTQALGVLPSHEDKPLGELDQLPHAYQSLSASLHTLAGLDSSQQAVAQALAQVASADAELAERAATAYIEADFEQARTQLDGLAAADPECLTLETWRNALHVMSDFRLAKFQQQFSQPNGTPLRTRIERYLGPQRLEYALRMDPGNEALLGQSALLGQVFLPTLDELTIRSVDRHETEQIVGALLFSFVQMLDSFFLGELSGLLSGQGADPVRNFIVANVEHLIAVAQAPNTVLGLREAAGRFDAFASRMIAAPKRTEPLIKNIAPLLAPMMTDKALDLARRLFALAQWRDAQAIYSRVSSLGASGPAQEAEIQAESSYAHQAARAMRRWDNHDCAKVLQDLSAMTQQQGIHQQLTDAVEAVGAQLKGVLDDIAAAGQVFLSPLPHWGDLLTRLDQCMASLDHARWAEEGVSALLPARFVQSSTKAFTDYLAQYNIRLLPTPANGKWFQPSSDIRLDALVYDLKQEIKTPGAKGAFDPVYRGLYTAAANAKALREASAPPSAVVAGTAAGLGAGTVGAGGQAAIASPPPPPTPSQRPAAPTPRSSVPLSGISGGPAAGRWNRLNISVVAIAGLVIVAAAFWAVFAVRRAATTSTAAQLEPTATATHTPSVTPTHAGGSGVAPLGAAPAATATAPVLLAPTGIAAAASPAPGATNGASPETAGTGPNSAPTPGGGTPGAPGATNASKTPSPTSAPTGAAATPSDVWTPCFQDSKTIDAGKALILCELVNDAAIQNGTTPRYKVHIPPGKVAYGFFVRFQNPNDSRPWLFYVKTEPPAALGEQFQVATKGKYEVELMPSNSKPKGQYNEPVIGNVGEGEHTLQLKIVPSGTDTRAELYMDDKLVAQNWGLPGSGWEIALVGLFARNEQQKPIQVQAWLDKK